MASVDEVAAGAVEARPVTAGKEHLSDDAMQILVQQFLDDWSYRIMASPLAKAWNGVPWRVRVQQSALEIMQLFGVKYTEEEIRNVAQQEEQMMILDLVERMDDSVREKFEDIVKQLQQLASVASDIRKGVDSKDDETLKDAFEREAETVMGQAIMKKCVVNASKEVYLLHRSQNQWKKTMQAKLTRLLASTDMAEEATQKLLTVEAQIKAFAGESNEKTKSVLNGLAGGQASTLMHTVFSAWKGDWMAQLGDKQIRAKFEDQLRKAEKALVAHKENKIKNIKAVLMTQSRAEGQNLLSEIIRMWVSITKDNKMDGETKAKMEALNAKLGKFKTDQAENTKKVMSRLSNDRDGMLVLNGFKAWQAFCEEYKKDKEIEDAVKASEGKWKDHMNKKKDEAKKVLDSMSAATNSGLVQNCFTVWMTDTVENKDRKKLENLMHEEDCRLKSFLGKQAGNAMGVQTRTIEQMQENLILKTFGDWMIITKVAKHEKHYAKKMEGKRAQLSKVQNLFKKFAQQLEDGLDGIDGDSSARTNTGRKKYTHLPNANKMSPGMTRGDGSVSLPDIKHRPA